MTNKFYNKKASLSVYIVNLAEYVKGNLVGDWISLPIELLYDRPCIVGVTRPFKVELLSILCWRL